jgi:proteic killer suppression protein
MIRSFRNAYATLAWNRQAAKGFSIEVLRAAYRKLMQLNSARSLADLRSPPGNRLEALKGRRAGQYSMRITDQWRVCFRWQQGDAFDVEVCDDHDE